MAKSTFLTMFGLILGAFVASSYATQICSSNNDNTVRGCDSFGCGDYGASRSGGTRKHKGTDITCTAGSDVYAPFPGKILRRSSPYVGDSGAYNDGLLIEGSGDYSAYKAKMWYFTPSKTSGTITQGGKLGTLKSLQPKYPGITDHVHITLYKNGDIVNPDVFLQSL